MGITKPSLLNKPVDNTPTILIISLFGSLVFGSAYLLFKEKESDYFELKDFIQMLPEGFVEIISTKDIESLEDKTIYLKEFINDESKAKINLITLGDIEKKNIQIVKSFLTKEKKYNTKIELKDSILDIKNENDLNNNFLILEFGSITYSQIETFKKYKQLFNISTIGTIILKK